MPDGRMRAISGDPVELFEEGLERLHQADRAELASRGGPLDIPQDFDGQPRQLSSAQAAEHAEHLRETANGYLLAALVAGIVQAGPDDEDDEDDEDDPEPLNAPDLLDGAPDSGQPVSSG